MKICRDCQFYDRVSGQVAPGQLALVDVCTNTECKNPVTGDVVSCGALRSNECFCGINGKHYKKRPLETTTARDIKDNVIQLVK